jgi:hypothetical protein
MALRIDEIVNKLKGALDAFAQGLSGTTSIARDPYNVFELVAANPRGYLLVLHWAGDKNISEVVIHPLLAHRLEVIISRNLGLPARPDAALVQTIGTVPPLFQSVDDLRNLLLGLQFPAESTGQFLEYAGTGPLVTPEGVPLAAYQLDFNLRALPASSPNQIPI